MAAQNLNAPQHDLSLSNNPFIWGNIILIASVPWFLALSMAGLAVGDPVFPTWFEIFLLGFPAIALVTWVQWQQPFSPFSLWFVAKPTESLSDKDRQVLTLIKRHSNGWYVTGWISIAVSLLLSAVFCKIYIAAPLAQEIAPFPSWLRFLGVLWAEFFFLLSNILLQSGVSALRIKLTAESEIISLQPFPVEKIKNSFTNIGWRSPQLLKFFEDDLIDLTPEKSGFSEDIAGSVNNELVEPIADEQSNQAQDINESEEVEANSPVNEIHSEQDPEILDITQNEELEISEIVAEEAVQNWAISDVTETTEDQVLEVEVESLKVDLNLKEEIVEEIKQLDIENVVDTSEVEDFLEVSDINLDSSPKIAVSEFEETTDESILEIDDAHLAQDIVEESQEVVSNEIVGEDPTFELLSDITNTNLELNLEEPELAAVEQSITDEYEIEDLSELTVQESVEHEVNDISDVIFNNIENEVADKIIDESDFEPILDVADNISETEVADINGIDIEEITRNPELDEVLESDSEESNETEAILESPKIEEEFLEETEELEIEDFAEESLLETGLDTAQSNESNSIDLFRKYRKKKLSQKKSGFGKSIKFSSTDVASNSEIVESNITEEPEELEISEIAIDNVVLDAELDMDLEIADTNPQQDLVESIDIKIEIQVDQDIENNDSRPQDFDNQIEEQIVLNLYNQESTDENNQEVEDIDKVAAISEQPAVITKEVLEDLALSESVPETINQPPFFESELEQIGDANTEMNVESISQNLLGIKALVDAESDEIQSESNVVDENNEPQYLVEEVLVDKFLARIEELNIADKANKAASDRVENSNSQVDEFADLEALIDRKPHPED